MTSEAEDPVAQAIADGYVARCKGGSFSDNTDFSGTCSSDGDVDFWLAVYGECRDGTVIALGDDASCDDHDGFDGLLPADFEPTPGPDDVAKCDNGLYSSNTDFGGTCSANGGVEMWLAPYGQCADGTIITMSEDASCDSHDGFDTLLPADFTPPTTAAPTTTAPPTANTPCASAQSRSADLVCVPSDYGLIWIAAPFAESDDKVALLPGTATPDAIFVVGDYGITAAGFQTLTSYGQTYWCINAAVKNLSSSQGSYNLYDFSLLTSTGSIESATVPLADGLEALLSSGELAPDGFATGVVCFNEPKTVTGRFGVIYDPLGSFEGERAVFYFDR